MRISIFGSGYVGLVTGACMAETGNHVVCVDIDEDRINRLNAGEVPIYEPGLNDFLGRNRESGRIEFTTLVTETPSVKFSMILLENACSASVRFRSAISFSNLAVRTSTTSSR